MHSYDNVGGRGCGYEVNEFAYPRQLNNGQSNVARHSAKMPSFAPQQSFVDSENEGMFPLQQQQIAVE